MMANSLIKFVFYYSKIVVVKVTVYNDTVGVGLVMFAFWNLWTNQTK